MLDIFTNVFGKSKKSSGANGPSSLNDDSPGEAEGFVFVRPTNPENYKDRNVMLTTEMIMGSSSSIISNGSNNNNNSSSVNYPSLDNDINMASNNNNKTVLPFASPSAGPVAPARGVFVSKKTSSLIDNVPMVFSLVPTSGNGGSSHGGLDDNDNDIAMAINRVEQFLNGSSSIYTFNLENSIVRESLAASLQ